MATAPWSHSSTSEYWGLLSLTPKASIAHLLEMASNDLAQKTLREQAHWNGHASIYTDIYIIKDQLDATSQAVIAAVDKHSLAKGTLINGGNAVMKGKRAVCLAYRRM